jgi:DNA-binding CsgD family transcriptional regulator
MVPVLAKVPAPHHAVEPQEFNTREDASGSLTPQVALAAANRRLEDSWECLKCTLQLRRLTFDQIARSRSTLARIVARPAWFELHGDVQPAGRQASASSASMLAGPTPSPLGVAVDERLGQLSARQKEILHYVAQGGSNKEIARQLSIEPATVKAHLRLMMSKLGVKNRTALAVLALRAKQ